MALEDVHEHLQLLLVGVDVDDLAVEVGERAGRHLDRLAQRVLDRRAGALTAGGERARATIEYSLGESVKVTSGPLSDFDGEIVDVNPDQQKLKVLVDIFERQVPVELGFDQVKKLD